jgi:hypothetical protein
VGCRWWKTTQNFFKKKLPYFFSLSLNFPSLSTSHLCCSTFCRGERGPERPSSAEYRASTGLSFRLLVQSDGFFSLYFLSHSTRSLRFYGNRLDKRGRERERLKKETRL